MNWTEEETVKFVKLYCDCECLWNMNTATRRDKDMRRRAIEYIIEGMYVKELGELEVIEKIKVLRSAYRKELLKVSNSRKSASADLYVPAMKWFPMFDAIMKKGKTTKQNEKMLVPKRGYDLLKNLKHSDGSNQQIEDAEKEAIFPEDSPRDQLPTSQRQSSTPKTYFVPSTRKRSYSSFETVGKTAEKLSNPFPTHADDGENEFDLFCRSLAIQLKNMPLDRALVCQQQLQKVMTEERMYQYRMEHLLSQAQENQSSFPQLFISCTPYASCSSTPMTSPNLQDRTGSSPLTRQAET